MADINCDSPARIYDRYFVPALFGQWGPVVSKEAGIQPGHRVLDVACGTGALTLSVAEAAGPSGQVTGVDINPEMLEIAEAKSSAIEWRQSPAEKLPFDNDRFDVVVSQFGFMFFDDQVQALREILRVLRPGGGSMAIAVCDALDHSPGYAVLTELLHRLFGESVASAFRAPFSYGDARRLAALGGESGVADIAIKRRDGTVSFPSIAALVSTERACAWTLGGLLDDDQFDILLKAADESLAPFTQVDGSVLFNMPALIVTGHRPS